MVKNYLKVMIRNMFRYKVYLGINVMGLTIAICTAVMAIGLVLDESTFDDFHVNADQLYKLKKRNVNVTTGTESLTSETSGQMGPTLAREFPEVEESLRIAPWFDPVLITYQEESLYAQDFVFADSNFFQMFSFNLKVGNPDLVLKNPATLVLTESFARRLFGDKDPVGEAVIGINDVEFIVTGIVEDAPRNSHIRFEAIASWSTTIPQVGPLSYSFFNNWLGQTLYTYLKISPEADLENLESKFPDFMERNFPRRADSYFLFLQPFNEIYLNSYEHRGNRALSLGSSRFTRLFGIIASFILLIAVVNYININTAKATKRAAEVGMRKVLGAQRKQLILQFLGESIILSAISASLGLLVADLAVPYFNHLTGKSIALSGLIPQILPLLISMVVIVGVLSGIYPALILSSFKPISVLKYSGKSHNAGSIPRKILTVFQFAISVVLIAVTILVWQQTKFLVNKDLGFAKENVLVVNTNNSIARNHEAFRNELMSYPDIIQVSICQAAIGTGTFGTTVIPEGMEEEMGTQSFRVDENFINTYQIDLKQGRWFPPNSIGNLIVNETFVEVAGWEDPILKTVKFPGDTNAYPVIGVVKDFNYLQLNEYKLDPVFMYIANRNYHNASVRIAGNNIQETLKYMEKVYQKYESRYPFDFYFVDQWFESKYRVQQTLLETITIFSVISILVACLGLYGLTAYTIEQRSLEIGIRKVFGASASSITMLINKRFLMLVLVAFLLASPIAYFLMNKWLETFPYRIDIRLEVFGIAGATILVIALLAVTIQAMKAAFTNPVNTLNKFNQ